MAGPANSWKLETSVAEATQGLVATGYSGLECGRALFLELPPESNGKWLPDVQAAVPVTAASAVGCGARLEDAAAVAFTWSGLQRMDLPETALASFSAPFKEGMLQEDRLRRLGDRRNGKWLDTVVQNGPRWSGNTPSQRRKERVGAYSVKTKDQEEKISTPISVHALFLIYTKDDAAADRLVAEVERILEPHNVRVVHKLPLLLDVEGGKFSREHFGFADGLSQPAPFDKNGAVQLNGVAVKEPDPVQGVPLGEFIIGYENGHQEVAPGPVVAGSLDGEDDPRPDKADLPAHPDALGFFDIGLHGSYLVVRELHQDVAAFWNSMEKAAQIIRERDPEATYVTGEWLAERVVGRTRDGHVLRPDGPLKPGPGDRPDNGFLFYDADHTGLGCPLGSHVRRANPRDSLAQKPEMKQTLLNAANNHRILRRGRKYGPNLPDPSKDDGQDRGLLFMCLNTDIARQFEFVQQTWLLNKDFATLFEEVDPLVGSDGWMTIPEDPLRRRLQVQTFVQMVGGEYFFLPSLPALRYLALL